MRVETSYKTVVLQLNLNAARNIAKVFFGIFAKIEDIRQEIKDAKDVKNAKKDQTYSSDEPLNRSVTF